MQQPPSPHAPEIDERLPEAVLRAYELSRQHCDFCSRYHGIWPTIRASKVTSGLDRDRPALLAALRPLMPEVRDILVAGAADTGLMCLMLQAAGGQPVKVTVIDRCETPLTLCRELAAHHGFEVETRKVTLQAFERPQSFDLVFGHSVFGHIPHAEQPPAIRQLFECLRPGGHILLAFRDRLQGDEKVTGETRSVEGWSRWVRDRVERWVEETGQPLPEDREAFFDLLHAYAATRADRHPGSLAKADFQAMVTAAGFELVDLPKMPPSKIWEAGGTVQEEARPGFGLLARRPEAR